MDATDSLLLIPGRGHFDYLDSVDTSEIIRPLYHLDGGIALDASDTSGMHVELLIVLWKI